MFDAYTVKKVLPRLVIAVILIQLSWFIFTGMITLTTAVAYGVEGLIYAPFGGADALSLSAILRDTDGGVGLFTGMAVVGGLGILGIAFSLAGTALLGMLMAFALLMFRQVLIVALLVVSPLALVAWILPNTEKFWKIWWESFSKLLIVFPMILGVIAIGRVFAFISADVRPGGESANLFTAVGIDNIIGVCFIVVGIFGPFFFIPKLFAIAGSAFAFISGMANDRSKGAFDRLKKGRQTKRAQQWQDTRSGNFFHGGNSDNLRGRLNKRIQQGAHVGQAGLRPHRWGSAIRSATGATNKQMLAEFLEKDADYATWKGNDDLNKAAAASTDARTLRQALKASGNYDGREAQMEDDIARVERVRRKMGNQPFRQMTWQQAVAGGTAYQSAAEAWKAAGEISGGDDTVLADMVAQGRSAAMSAGRIEQGGAGFMTTFDTARKMRDEGLDEKSANSTIYQDVIDSQGAGVIAHASMKPNAIKELVPEMRRRLQNAKSSGNEEAYDRELASFANVYDAMAQTSPNKARILADDVMRWNPTDDINAAGLPIGAGTVYGPADSTIQRDIEARRGSQAFQSTRRELNASQQEAGRMTPGAGGTPTSPNSGISNTPPTAIG